MKQMVALLSLYDKTGIESLAKELHKRNVRMVASGGTAQKIKDAGLPVEDVAKFVGGEAILGHRVVTLSRELAAALLSRDTQEDEAELRKAGVPRIDFVFSNLYPLEEEIAKPGSTEETVTEQTDIGGPTLLREAAKGRRIVVTDPNDYELVFKWLDAGQPEKDAFLRRLAAKAEYVVSKYALASARYLSCGEYDATFGQKKTSCKYGENAWQTPAGLYSRGTKDPLSLDQFEVLAGTDPSYNNFCDIDRLLQTTTHIAAGFHLNFKEMPFIAVAVKHGNACGAAVGNDKKKVLENMIEGDTRAIFGGLVMVNFPLDEELAETILTYLMPEKSRRLLDGIIASEISPGAVEMLRRKGDKCRLIANPSLAGLESASLDCGIRFRYVRGGFLTQPNYTFVPDLKKDIQWNGEPSENQMNDMLMAWAIGSTSNSNTMTLVKDGKLVGNGVSQQDRVGAARVALFRADESQNDIEGASAYSDSFFPFNDGIETLYERGIKSIFATSGSINDPNIIKFCEQKGIVLGFVPDAQGRGFFGH